MVSLMVKSDDFYGTLESQTNSSNYFFKGFPSFGLLILYFTAFFELKVFTSSEQLSIMKDTL